MLELDTPSGCRPLCGLEGPLPLAACAANIYHQRRERSGGISRSKRARHVPVAHYHETHTCALQVIGLSDGELTIARIEAEGRRVVECGADGDCVFHAFLVGAILNDALELAVSQSARRPVDLLGRIG